MPSIRISNLRIDVTQPEVELPKRLAKTLGLSEADITRWRILRKSLDARSRNSLKFVYTILVELPDGPLAEKLLSKKTGDVELFAPPQFDDVTPGTAPLEQRPVVIGSGPAGLLAGYLLAAKGYRPVIIERGQRASPGDSWF